MLYQDPIVWKSMDYQYISTFVLSQNDNENYILSTQRTKLHDPTSLNTSKEYY